MSSFPSCRVDFSTATQRHPSANVGTKAEPKLDGKHVVFGRVIEGIDKLSKAPVCIAKMAGKETSCLIKYSSNKSILKLTAKISYQFTIHPFQSISHFLTLHPISNRHGDFSSALNSSNLWVQKEALHSSRRSLKQHRLSKIIEKHDERVWKTCKYISIEKIYIIVIVQEELQVTDFWCLPSRYVKHMKVWIWHGLIMNFGVSTSLDWWKVHEEWRSVSQIFQGKLCESVHWLKPAVVYLQAVISDCGELESEALRTRKRKLEEAPGERSNNQTNVQCVFDLIVGLLGRTGFCLFLIINWCLHFCVFFPCSMPYAAMLLLSLRASNKIAQSWCFPEVWCLKQPQIPYHRDLLGITRLAVASPSWMDQERVKV